MGLAVARSNPFRVEVAVFAHQAHLSVLAVGAKLFCRVDGKNHRFVLSLIWTELIVAVLDVPSVLIFVSDDEIARSRHGFPRFPVDASTPNAGTTAMFLLSHQT